MILPRMEGLILKTRAVSYDDRYVSCTERAIAKPKGISAGTVRTLTPTFFVSTIPTTVPGHPRNFPFVRTTLQPLGKRSFNVKGPRSTNRGSGAGACHNASCNGMSASSRPNTLVVDPFDVFVFIPCKGNTLSRILISLTLIPPDPGAPFPP